MSSGRLLALVAGAAVGVLVSPLGTLDIASAAQLPVTAAPLQTWKITHGLPAVTTTPEDVEADATGSGAASAADASQGSLDSDHDPRTPTPDDSAPADDPAAGQAPSGVGHQPTDKPAAGAEEQPPLGGDEGTTSPDSAVEGLLEGPVEGAADVGR